MCGIAGIFQFAGEPRDTEAQLVRMRDAIAHRGPDDAGTWISPDRRVLLGHRRLSIVDLSPAGHQPMQNEDGRVWITFNGEIYNHESLRGPLIQRGHHFRSRSDTEAIIHLYEEHGVECVTALDGMFAFALWDQGRQRLLCARDRLGKKPLYYTVLDGRLLFASEIKALLAHPEVPRELDLVSLDLYLTFANVPAPRTLFRGIFKLPAAHFLTCDAHGQISTRRYWSPLVGPDWPATSDAARDQEAIETVRHLLREAVRKRLMSDVPIGAFLSGGVDSSTNVALMSQLVSEPLRTFSVGFRGFGEAENFHDLPYARQVAERFGCRHQEVVVTAEECKAYLPELAWQQDEPIGDPACLPMHFVSQAARQAGVTVVLVGEGSDEVFCGYDDMQSVLHTHDTRWQMVQRLPRLLRAGLHKVSQLSGAPAGRIDVLRRAVRGEPLYWGLDVVFWDTEKADLLTAEARGQMGPGAAPIVQGYYDEMRRLRPEADFLQQISYVELSNRLPELLLMRVDKLTMAHSLEARAPFLDYHLVAYVLSRPANLKIRNGRTKYLLKEAVRPLLPEAIIERPKQGFRVPLPAWLAHDLSAWAERLLRDSPLMRRGLFRREYIDWMWRRHRDGTQDHSFDLWCLLNLAAWYEHWIEGKA
ncbi:MAG: asparagine synthase (glutamine-hydrolyzing) [Myxococcales bacterium]|nr:asparagine synthase (glutamine-hydrolyzing) [Myxococcota bacterium]MDW8283615.1 asparagine synthase (glutamine-hydrolyzing) [Myxococcales bacterium]